MFSNLSAFNLILKHPCPKKSLLSIVTSNKWISLSCTRILKFAQCYKIFLIKDMHTRGYQKVRRLMQ